MDRAVEHVHDRPLQEERPADKRELLEIDGEVDPDGPPPDTLDRPLDELVELDDDVRLVGLRVVPREHPEVPDEHGQLGELALDVLEELAPVRVGKTAPAGLRSGQQVDVRAQAGQRRAQLVAGIGHELALLGPRPVQGPQHVVEPGCQLGQLPVARLGDRRLQVTRPCDVAGGTGQSPDRGGHRATDDRPQQSGEDGAAQPDGAQRVEPGADRALQRFEVL